MELDALVAIYVIGMGPAFLIASAARGMASCGAGPEIRVHNPKLYRWGCMMHLLLPLWPLAAAAWIPIGMFALLREFYTDAWRGAGLPSIEQLYQRTLPVRQSRQRATLSLAATTREAGALSPVKDCVAVTCGDPLCLGCPDTPLDCRNK